VAVPEALVARIRAQGSLSFEQFVDWALYEPGHGFFARGGGAGRRGGDFLTSVEVGPLFGASVATWLDSVWNRLGRPDPFTVIEAGAGRGALGLAVRAAAPRCAPCLHYVMVERSDVLRAAQGQHLELAVDVGPGVPLRGGGPRFSAAPELPPGPLRGVVLANELLDNLPFRLVELTAGGWAEVRIGLGADGLLRELRGELPAELARRCAALAPRARTGARLPLQQQAAAWVAGVLERLEGELLLFDYGATSDELADREQGEWLRTYRHHERGGPVLADPGSQDITVEVAFDQLPGDPHRRRQRDWLRDRGLDAMVELARREWDARAAIGDLAAMRARSVPREAEALCDPAGLGAFWVLQWRSGAPGPGSVGGYDPRGTTQESTEP
jgi:SAM-dependent MidA family methyltransferase